MVTGHTKRFSQVKATRATERESLRITAVAATIRRKASRHTSPAQSCGICVCVRRLASRMNKISCAFSTLEIGSVSRTGTLTWHREGGLFCVLGSVRSDHARHSCGMTKERQSDDKRQATLFVFWSRFKHTGNRGASHVE